MEAFRQAVVPEDPRRPARLLRFRGKVSVQIEGAATEQTQRLLITQITHLLAHSGLTAVSPNSGEDGQIVLQLVPRLDREALASQPDLLRIFWGGRERSLSTARQAFAAEVELPLTAVTRALLRWNADRDGHIVHAILVAEDGLYDVAFMKRIRREVSRILGIQGYGLGIGHSLFNLHAMAVDLTALDMRVLRTLYHPALPSGLHREAALLAVARLLDQPG
ncbi:DUF2927 domain-containing protein [Falsiroseomonas sp.]|uniref:DUF2927 domain-containing protein n=1 Tax=Falsiroseomonas sp. TaxID=2870721 RepID=UPI003F72FC39